MVKTIKSKKYTILHKVEINGQKSQDCRLVTMMAAMTKKLLDNLL